MSRSRPFTPPRARRPFVTLSWFAALAVALAGRAAADGPVELVGQVVCSECWTEADRKTTPYGTPEDLECAARCAKKGVALALAVKREDGYALHSLAPGSFQPGRKGFLPYVAKFARVSGRTAGGDGSRLLVDSFAVVPDLPGAAAEPPPLGGPAPPLAAVDLFGAEQTLAGLRGRIVILNFWATWCAPCREEMPLLSELQNEYGAWGVQVVGLAADAPEKKGAVADYVRKAKINFPIWLGASSGAMERLGLGVALPATALVDREGRLVARFRGVVTKTGLKSALDKLLAADEKKTAAAAPPRDPKGAAAVPS